VPTPTPFTYTVVPKDTLTRIAKRFGLTVDQILAANPAITDANVLKIGDKLVIPTPGPSGSASAAP
jgi:LysM repeat protein